MIEEKMLARFTLSLTLILGLATVSFAQDKKTEKKKSTDAEEKKSKNRSKDEDKSTKSGEKIQQLKKKQYQMKIVFFV